MKKFIYVILLIFVLSSCSDSPDSPDKSIEQAKLAIIDLYSYLEKQRVDAKECLAIELEIDPIDDNFQYLNVNEVHNNECEGDPETMPSYGHYKRNLNTGELYQMNHLTSEYVLLTKK